jgi:hypothetical protein
MGGATAHQRLVVAAAGAAAVEIPGRLDRPRGRSANRARRRVTASLTRSKAVTCSMLPIHPPARLGNA